MNNLTDLLVLKYENKSYTIKNGFDKTGAAKLRYILGCIDRTEASHNGHDYLVSLKALLDFDEVIFTLYLHNKTSGMTEEVKIGIIVGLIGAVSRV